MQMGHPDAQMPQELEWIPMAQQEIPNIEVDREGWVSVQCFFQTETTLQVKSTLTRMRFMGQAHTEPLRMLQIRDPSRRQFLKRRIALLWVWPRKPMAPRCFTEEASHQWDSCLPSRLHGLEEVSSGERIHSAIRHPSMTIHMIVEGTDLQADLPDRLNSRNDGGDLNLFRCEKWTTTMNRNLHGIDPKGCCIQKSLLQTAVPQCREVQAESHSNSKQGLCARGG